MFTSEKRSTLEDAGSDVLTGEPTVLACSACRAKITSTAARIEIGGAHEHACENPHGYKYRIGCFATAQGLVALGDPTMFYTWFPGYAWQVQNCRTCVQLIGWRFSNLNGHFYGLILAHLVEIPE